MGGLSSRSGTIALYGLDNELRHKVEAELTRARFGVVDLDDDGEPTQRVEAILLCAEPAALSSLHQLQARYPALAILAVVESGQEAARSIVSAFRAGVADAVLEDELSEISAAIRLAAERKRLDDAAAALTEQFTRELGQRARSLFRAYEQMEDAYTGTLRSLVRVLDVREEETAGHSSRVSYYTCYLARLCGVPDDQLEDIYRGALLHDIGKIGIPDSILRKPDKLTAEEFEVMKTHTDLAKRFLDGITYLETAAEIPYCHHERWDGTGYPRGLGGEDIPLSARIFAVADVYDALRSVRCYKDAYSHDLSVEIIRKADGEHFDPRIVSVFVEQPEEVWAALDEASTGDSNFGRMLEAFEELERDRPALVGSGGAA